MKEYNIPNYAGYKLVLPDSIYSYKQGTPQRLSSRVGANGYLSVTMTSDSGQRHPVELHRLIGILLVPNLTGRPFSDLEINHKDGNKLNNTLPNLEWTDRFGNQNHAYTLDSNTNKRCIIATCESTGEQQRYYSLRECARQFECSPMTLHERLNTYSGKPWRGHIVEYEDIV